LLLLLFLFIFLIEHGAQRRTYCAIRTITIESGAARGVASESTKNDRGAAR
jgi:hypothetical protein